MLLATQFLKQFEDFIAPQINLYEDAVLASSENYRNKDGKWFNQRGQFVGDTAEEVCLNDSLDVDFVEPYDYYLVEASKANALLTDKKCHLNQVEELVIVGLYSGGLTKSELKRYVG